MKTKNLKWFLATFVVSILSSSATLIVFKNYENKAKAGIQASGKIPVNYAGYFGEDNGKPITDFSIPAESATPAVVHIQTKTKEKIINNQSRRRQINPFGDPFGDDFFEDFFGGPRRIPEQQASGSGVIISEDGFIVTNNHVVKEADEITVTLANNKEYKATIIGNDANTDLAVIKIDEKKLPYILYGNSDLMKLGQWVLAIGYPLNLDVTVTAGIISAKNRNLGINQQANPNGAPIETFLQTDAAVNKGNSGGALVNIKGELVGINSAIVSPSGTYAGYSYAIPVNLVKKVVTDIIKYGMVQRAFLGIQGYNSRAKLPDDLKEKFKKETGVDIDEVEKGVVIAEVLDGGAAKKVGLKKGDVITQINERKVNTMPELQEQIANFKPGDKIKITYVRKDKINTVEVVLKNRLNKETIEKNVNILEKLGGELENYHPDDQTASKYNINGGILIKKKGNGLIGKSKIEEGFVIVQVNDEIVTDKDSLKKALEQLQNEKQIYIVGFYKDSDGLYRIPFSLNATDE